MIGPPTRRPSSQRRRSDDESDRFLTQAMIIHSMRSAAPTKDINVIGSTIVPSDAE